LPTMTRLTLSSNVSKGRWVMRTSPLWENRARDPVVPVWKVLYLGTPDFAKSS
jgi:hypothetical protein